MGQGFDARAKEASHGSLSSFKDAAPGRNQDAPAPAADAGGVTPGGYGGGSVFGGFGASDGGTDVGAQLDGKIGGAAVKAGAATSNADEKADAGFRGTPGALPHKAELEQSFGRSLDGIEAHTDASAKHANARMGANAYAAGNKIAFSAENPSKSLVAHEVTHVLQNSGGRSGAGGTGIDTGGEGEAEKVEATVAKGGSAKSALGTDPRKARGGAIQRSTGRPARSENIIMTTISPQMFEHGGVHELWGHGHGVRIPTTVPLLNVMFEPSVTLNLFGGVDWSRNVARGRAGVEGIVGVGITYGQREIAEVFADLEATASGGLTYEIGSGAGQEEGNHGEHGGGQGAAHGGGHAPAGEHAAPGNNWSLEGAFGLETAFNIGVRLGGGIIEKRFTFGRLEIGRLVGLKWVNGEFKRDQVGWHWGAVPQQVFHEISVQVQRAQQIMQQAEQAAYMATHPWAALGQIAGWMYHPSSAPNGRPQVGAH
jgi:hypothetical protein